MSIKKELYRDTLLFVENRYLVVHNLIASIQESLQSETKSSAGDKHETGRAMLQLEREKASNQFVEIKRLQHILQRIDIEKTTKTACLGSLVSTTNGTYFLAIGRGVVTHKNQSYFVIALNTPIGKLLLGKQKGDYFSFNNQEIEILEVE